MSDVASRYGRFIERVLHRTGAIVKTQLAPELRTEADWHLATLRESKGVRPALVRAAATISGWREDSLVDAAAAVQLIHEAMLVADDVFDKSPMRRGRASLYEQFGRVRATVTGWALITLAAEILDDDPIMRAMVRKITMRGCVAEALQERERYTARPLQIDTWRAIALGDTGGIFDLAVAAGGVEPAGFQPSEALAYLRHGLDDIDDLLAADGDQADVRDRVPTLPTCFTRGESREELLETIPAALRYLEPYLHCLENVADQRWLDAFGPFFRDMEQMWATFARDARFEATVMSITAPATIPAVLDEVRRVIRE